MNKLAAAARSRKYEIIIFVSLCMSMLLLLTKEQPVADRFYGALTFDTHFGVFSLTLIGSIIRLLFGAHPSLGNVVFFQTAALVFAFFLIAVYCGGAIRRTDEKRRGVLLGLMVFVSCVHIGFSDYTELFDLFDVYWLIGTVLSLFCAEKTYPRLLLPLLAATSLWVHFGFLMAFMPVIYIACIYYALKSENKKLAALQLALLPLITVPATLWFFFAGRSSGLPYEELAAYMADKTGIHNKEIVTYVWQHISDMVDSGVYDLSTVVDLFNAKVGVIGVAIGYIFVALQIIPIYKILVYLVLSSPLLVFFGAIWINSMKRAERKTEKFVFLLCPLSMLVNFVSLVSSSDSSRMAAQLIVSQLLLLMMFLRDGNPCVEAAFDTAAAKVKRYAPLLLPLCAFYFMMIYEW